MANESSNASIIAQPSTSSTTLVDLEKELSCSICTEILYQPLTLLKCLHTFCGSCLGEWFGFQRSRADQDYDRAHQSNGRSRRRRKPYIYTCPSCRAVVKDTQPSATFTTLVDMYLSANPARRKTTSEAQGIARMYTPGDMILTQPTSTELSAQVDGSSEGLSSDDEDERQVLQHVQELSLRDMSAHSQSVHVRRGHRHHQRAASNNAELREARRRNNDQDPARSRLQLGHQASLRSLLNPHDSEEMKEEIVRQIAEEGLLDDVDWDNMRVEQEDEISERIARAYKRRQRERPRPGGESRRRDGRSREPERPTAVSTQVGQPRSSSASSQTRPGQDRSMSESAQQVGDTSLPPVSRPHLFSDASDNPRHRRRSTSQGRLDVARPSTASAVQQAAARSATDLSDRPRSRDPRYERPRRSHDGRRTTDPESIPASEQWRNVAQPTSLPRARPERRRSSQPTSAPSTRTTCEPTAAAPPVASPAITVSCDRCGRHDIQHDLHYTCMRCGPPGSTYDLCLRCYRLGKGCLHWFGFGHAAWQRWERRAAPGSEPPHILRSQKYLDPQNLPSDDQHRDSKEPLLQLGVFCDVCHSNANSCYWHCPQCNDGEWGYCHRCVIQARHCVHPLLPMSLQSPTPTTAPATPTAGDRSPHSATQTPEAQLTPLILPTTCNVCQQSIPTTAQRLHCPDCADGDYDMCMSCYERLTSAPSNTRTGSRKCQQGHRLLLVDFAITNGAKDFAWRRVLEGHAGAFVPEGLIPPSEGNPRRAEAIWPWIPEDDVIDEIGFPKGAIIEDVVPVNEVFSFGVYCRRGAYLPSAYVRMI